jgi:exosortase/archaeosortase family protein
MGELYRLRLLPRAALVAIGLGLAFTFNVVRTLLLTWQAEKEGMGAIDKWHDPAGYSMAIACFICLWALAVLAARKWGSGQKAESRKQKAEMPLSAAVPSEEPQVSGFSLPPATAPPTSDLGPPTSDLRPPTSASPVSRPQVSGFKSHSAKTPQVSGFRFHPSARSYLLAVGLWSLFCIFATEVWYRSHVSSNAGVFYWSIAMPTNNPTFEPVELPPRTTRLISADEAASGKWMEDGVEWSAHFFRWKPRSVSDVITSRVHRPEVCLTASGLEQVGDSELVTFDAGHLKLPFRRYTFRAEGRTLHVFFCQWEDGAEQQSGMQASKQADRLQSVLRGRRLVGQQTLEIILTGQSSLDQAEQAVRTHLPTLVQQETRGPWEGAETSLPYR